MMRKDYQLIAAVIKAQYCLESGDYKPQEQGAISNLARALATELRRDNARFDYDRFIDACGTED